MAQEWIDVKDSLPDYDEDAIVLSSYVNGKYIEGAYAVYLSHREQYSKYENKWSMPGVSFWMPFPEIPDKKEEED